MISFDNALRCLDAQLRPPRLLIGDVNRDDFSRDSQSESIALFLPSLHRGTQRRYLRSRFAEMS